MTHYTEDPRIISVCLNCPKKRCYGSCDAYLNTYADVIGKEDQEGGKATTHVGRVFEYRGERHTIREWSKILDIPWQNIYHRLAIGMTFADAVKQRILPRKVRRHKVGQLSMTLNEWADFSGVPYSTLTSRMLRGESLQSIFARRCPDILRTILSSSEQVEAST